MAKKFETLTEGLIEGRERDVRRMGLTQEGLVLLESSDGTFVVIDKQRLDMIQQLFAHDEKTRGTPTPETPVNLDPVEPILAIHKRFGWDPGQCTLEVWMETNMLLVRQAKEHFARCKDRS